MTISGKLNIKPTVIWLTGLSGSGKTTIANELAARLNVNSIEPVMLDGDVIRNANKLQGFDETFRKQHNLNVGYTASLFEQQGKVVIVALISP
jgi:adenylylsulfate kinase